MTDFDSPWKEALDIYFEQPGVFGYDLWGCELSFRYPTIKLLEYRDRTDELEPNPNPFAVVVLAHLRTLETRQDAQARRSRKTSLVRSLYERGFGRTDVLQLFRFIDWLMDLPAELELQFREDVAQLEQEKRMPYVTSIERLGRAEGRAEGAREQALRDIEAGLRAKFGEDGLALMPAIRHIRDLASLEAVLDKLWTATRLDELPLNGETEPPVEPAG